MLWPDLKIYTIDIPKTACATRWCIGKKMHGPRLVPGHMKVSTAIIEIEKLGFDINDIQFWAVIRNPAKRLVSACNFHYAALYKTKRRRPSLYSYIKQVQNSKYENGPVFRPQASWIDVDVDVKLWPLEHLDDMIRQLGWKDEIIHENQSHKYWTYDELVAMPQYNSVMAKYAPDWELYKKAQDNFILS